MSVKIIEPVRQKLMNDLLRNGPAPCAAIAERIGASQKTVSNLMGILNKQGIVYRHHYTHGSLSWWALTFGGARTAVESPIIGRVDKDEVDDPEHQEWMAHWRVRWQARQERHRRFLAQQADVGKRLRIAT